MFVFFWYFLYFFCRVHVRLTGRVVIIVFTFPAVRGCIVASDIAALNLVIVKQGDSHLHGLTDNPIPRRLGPKRLDKIQKMSNLGKDDDPRDFIFRRQVKRKSGNRITKKLKIQVLFVYFYIFYLCLTVFGLSIVFWFHLICLYRLCVDCKWFLLILRRDW